MKKTLVIASLSACVLLSTNVLAQASSSSSTTDMSKASMRAANHALAKKIRGALSKARPTIPTENIAILVKSGAVTLVGEVESQEQVDEAGKIAGAVDGVTKLSNNLGIEERGM